MSRIDRERLGQFTKHPKRIEKRFGVSAVKIVSAKVSGEEQVSRDEKLIVAEEARAARGMSGGVNDADRFLSEHQDLSVTERAVGASVGSVNVKENADPVALGVLGEEQITLVNANGNARLVAQGVDGDDVVEMSVREQNEIKRQSS